MQNCSLPTPPPPNLASVLTQVKRLEWTWGNKSLSSLLPSGGKVGKPKRFLWSLLHLTCSCVSSERHCARNGEGTGLLGDSSEDEDRLQRNHCSFTPFHKHRAETHCSGNPPLQGGLWMKAKSIWVFDISLSFNAKTEWHLRTRQGRSWHWCLKSHPPSGGWIKMYLVYIYNHARVRKELWQEEKCAIIFLVRRSPKETDSQLQEADGQTHLTKAVLQIQVVLQRNKRRVGVCGSALYTPL